MIFPDWRRSAVALYDCVLMIMFSKSMNRRIRRRMSSRLFNVGIT